MQEAHGMSIGQRLRRERQRLGWSQERLAEAIGATSMSIRRWEHDQVTPHPHYQALLAEVFHTSVERLFLAPLDEPGSASSPELLWHLPFRRNPFFTGREALLQAVHQMLGSNRAPGLPVALTGLGGIGKTQTALEYASRFRHQYQAVLWVQAGSRALFLESMAALARALQLPEQYEADQARAVQGIRRWLQRQLGWLLIVDNLEDLELLEEVLVGTEGHTLLTTRAHALGTLARSVELPPLSPAEGTLLLLHRAKRLPVDAPLDQAPGDERAWAQAITTALDGLPLALDQAGAYIEETGCGLEGYLLRLQTQKLAVLAQRGLTSDHPASVLTTLAVACEQIEQVNPSAGELLRLCAFLHPEAIPEELLAQGAPESGALHGPVAGDLVALDAAIGALCTFSLIRRDPVTKTLSIHRLVQVVVQETLLPEQQRYWAERTVHVLSCTLPEVTSARWTAFQRFFAHALAGVSLISRWQLQGGEAVRLLAQTGAYLRERAQYAEAEPLLRQAWALQKRLGGRPHPETAATLHHLADLFWARGQYRRAEVCYRRSLQLWEQVFGAQHPLVAQTWHNLGTLKRYQGCYTEAETYYRRALAIQGQTLGPDHLDVAQSLDSLGTLATTLGRYQEAEGLHRQALAIAERSLGRSDPQVAVILNNLALQAYLQAQYEQAEPLYQEVIHIQEYTLGATHPHLANSLYNLARVYTQQGRAREAELLYRRALAIYEQALGTDHPRVAHCLSALAQGFLRQGEATEAESLCLRALRIRQQSLGPEHPDTANSLRVLAQVYHAQGRAAQAEVLYQQVVQMHEQTLGPNHPLLASELEYYAQLLQQLHREEEAAALQARAQAIRAHLPSTPPLPEPGRRQEQRPKVDRGA